MILRAATAADAAVLESFDLGGETDPWMTEVKEIVSGLLAWRDDSTLCSLDRQVIVAEISGEIVAVAAHERVEHERFGALDAHRYLMVVAVPAGHRRSGLARTVTESILVEMQRAGVRTVQWLVHPRNAASLAFSRSVFPEADELQPPEDRPYVKFVLGL